jgi:DNA-binding transcriptional LysR family regulator
MISMRALESLVTIVEQGSLTRAAVSLTPATTTVKREY